MKVADIAPSGIVTLDAISALKLEDTSDTVVPPIGAGPEMVSVPTAEVPPTTGDVDQRSEDGVGACTVTKTL